MKARASGTATRVVACPLHLSHFMARATPVERPEVCGVGISHPDRQIFPALSLTKLDLARYFERVAGWMLPHVVDRPLTLVRCPEGVPADPEADGGCFFMKHSKLWAPPALRRVRVREKTKVGDYLVADSAAALVSLAQMGIVEVHTWNSTCADLERPNRVVLDIDPGRAVTWPSVVEAARLIRGLLAAFDLESFVKTTGGRGLHVVVPLKPRATWDECLAFAKAVAEVLVRRDRAAFTIQFSRKGRNDKLLIDYLRNNRTNTSVAAYSTRARPSATVSVPLAWSELSAARQPDRFTIATIGGRLARLKTDPWSGYFKMKQLLPRSAVDALNRM
jgi:bifunctional non-homologous end joining protein LigD